MRSRRSPQSDALAAVLMAALLAAPGGSFAQTADAASGDDAAPAADAVPAADAAETEADAADDAALEDALLSEEELDDLVAPIALYPDALLTQVFVASTYPLDVVKADRWIDDAEEMSAEARAEAAFAEGWDASVVALAAGFPAVIDRMAEDLDATETLGDVLLVQPDDVLDAVQRQRARAQALGNLETNAAQTVVVEDDAIAIAPTDPEVIYVPAYDSQAVYAQSLSEAPRGSFDDGPEVVYVNDGDDGYSGGEMLVAGALAFGAGMLVNEVFNDDDDWNGYWGPGYRPVNWNGGQIYPRPGYGQPNRVNNVRINGDVNIGRGGNSIDIDRRDADLRRRNASVDRDGAWQPDRDRREEARRKVAARDGGGSGSASLRPDRDRGDREGIGAGGAAAIGGGAAALGGAGDRSRDQLRSKLSARSPEAARTLNKPSARPGASNSAASDRAASARPAAPRKTGKGSSAFSGARDGSLSGAKTQRDRGAVSAAKAKRPAAPRPAANSPAAKRPAATPARAAPKQIKRPAPSRKIPAARKPSGGGSAFGGARGGNRGAVASRGGRSGGRIKRR